jgi:hypothetical protein
MAALLSPEQIAQIVEDLKVKDYYDFRAEIHDVLLE